MIAAHSVPGALKNDRQCPPDGRDARNESPELRAELPSADAPRVSRVLDASTFANKDADPEVKARQKALAQVRAANKPVMHGTDNLVNPQGLGELPTQLRQFANDPATSGVFDRVMGSKGYSVKSTITTSAKGVKTYLDDTLYYTDPNKAGATPITGAALDKLIQNNPDRQDELLSPFRELGRTPEFQRKQVLDFNDRLVGAVGKKPAGYNYPISSYVSSESSSALVLDQDVNRPGFVKADFGSALDSFYADNPGAPKNPDLWSAVQRAEYEPDIVDNYSAVRRGTDMVGRATKLGAAGLSDAPGSLTFPTGP
jgi:hypothetical protein